MEEHHDSIFDRPVPFLILLVSANIALVVLFKVLFVFI